MLLNEILKIKYPIIQGAMAHIATPEFAACVSNSGGLGIITTATMTADQARVAIVACKALTDKPFGVNLMLMNPNSEEIIKVIIEEKVPVVTTGAGNPGIYVPALKAAGIKVFPVVANVALAIRLERSGVDGIIVEGCEAGGHIGESTTMSLLPQVVKAVSIPVIGAGGIAGGKQLNAALSLGAVGVQVGTCLLVAEECPVHANYKEAVIKAKDSDTIVTGRAVQAPVRILKNQMSRKYIELEMQGSNLEELEKLTLGALRKAVFEGDVKHGSVMIGQVAGLVDTIRPLADIFKNMVTEAQAEVKVLEAKCQELIYE